MPANSTPPPAGMANLAKLRNNTAEWWFRDPGLRKLSLGIIVGYSGSIAAGFDNSLTAGLLSNPLFYAALNVPADKLGLVLAATLLGIPLGAPISAYTADKYGRRFNIAFGSVIIIAGALVQALTTGGYKMLGGKVILGFGSAFSSIACGPYTAEISHPRNRPQTTALINTFYYVGSVMAAWTTYGTLVGMTGSWTWRLPVILQVVPSALMLIAVPFIPESPRFMMANGRVEEGHKMLAKYHANGDMDDELVMFEVKEIMEALENERALTSNVTFATFFKTKGNRHRLAIVVLTAFLAQWVGNGIISTYLPLILDTVGITNAKQQTAFNGGLQIWNWIAATTSAMLCERLGRRFLWLFSATGMLFSFVVITACSASFANTGNVGAGRAVLAFLFIYFGFYDSAFNSMTYVYILEILPYSLRTKGFAVFTFGTCCAGFFNIYVNPIALAAIAWKYYFVYIAINAFAIVIIWFYYPETKGRLLEEVAEVFDGPSAALPVQGYYASNLPEEEKATLDIETIEHV